MTPTERLAAVRALADALQAAYERHTNGHTMDREKALRMAEDLLDDGWRKP